VVCIKGLPGWVKSRLEELSDSLALDDAKINDESLLAFGRFFLTIVPNKRCAINLTPTHDLACTWHTGKVGFSVTFTGVLNQAVSLQSVTGVCSDSHGNGKHSDGIGSESSEEQVWV